MGWQDDEVVSTSTTPAWQQDEVVKQPKPKQSDSIMSRIGTGLADPIYGAAQLADKAINPIRQMISPGASSMDDVVKAREAEYQAPEGFDFARMGGNVANPLTWVGPGKGKVLTKASEALLAHPIVNAAATRPVQRSLVGNTGWQNALNPYSQSLSSMISAALRGDRNEDIPSGGE